MEDSAVAGSGANQRVESAHATPWASRLAGVLLILVGVLNIIFGVISLSSTVIQLGTGAAIALIVAGAVTAVGGWLVWGGNRSVTHIALIVFAWLLVIQIADVVSHSGPVTATGGIASRFTVLGLLIAALVVATLQLRRLHARR